ncbi:MAG TPA: N-acetyl sugar amidotransferase [Bacteroidales bacterium]|nr:N-acetyl sugar amidotransferase [Bacteroidales bacterium]
MSSGYRICSKTVMDNVADPDISFDNNGVCNYYHEYSEKLKVRIPEAGKAEEELKRIVASIRKVGTKKEYDCIIGVSGGVDSTYTAWLVKKMGLRPLAVHLDNGWDSEMAVKNVENILRKLGIDLYTEVLDWEMFRDLQLSFLKASTPDGEIPTDHAILAVLYKIAEKFKVKYIISGMNFRSEGMLPPTWARGYLDWKYIKSVQKKFGTKGLKSFPHLSVASFLYYNLIKGIRSISILNYVEFNRQEAINIIQEELGWRNYGGKHHESVYTRFYQAYILPRKFGIDKRKAHLTCLMISTGEVNREQALEELKNPPADPKLLSDDRSYLLKKLSITSDEFDEIMSLPVKSILDYPNNHFLERKFREILTKLRRMKIMPN